MWSRFGLAFVLRPMIRFALLGFCLVPERCYAQAMQDNSLSFLQTSGNLLEGVLLTLIFFALAISMPLCSFLIVSKEKAYFSISLTSLCAGVYSLSATDFGPFLLTLPVLWNYLAMISLFLLPVGICKFLGNFCPEQSIRFYLSYLEKGHISFALLSLIGVATGLVSIAITLKIFFLLLVITLAVFFLILLNAIRLGKENAEIIIGGLLFFLGSSIISSVNKTLGYMIPVELSTIWGFLGLIACLILALKKNIHKQHGQTSISSEFENTAKIDSSPPDKTDLLSFIHEVNTPLGTGILTASHLEKEVEELYELFRSDELKKSDLETHLLSYRESVTIITANLQNAVNIIQDFKTDSKTESQLPQQTFNVLLHINQLLTALKPRIRQAGHQMHFSCPDNLTITSYPSTLSQIITNLIMNSLTHAYPEGKNGNLSLQISSDSDSLYMKYSDDGKGIEKKMLHKLFDPYFTTNKLAGNSGLGLFVVYTLVTQRLGGSIECQSIPGKMTTFFIRFTIERR